MPPPCGERGGEEAEAGTDRSCNSLAALTTPSSSSIAKWRLLLLLLEQLEQAWYAKNRTKVPAPNPKCKNLGGSSRCCTEGDIDGDDDGCCNGGSGVVGWWDNASATTAIVLIYSETYAFGSGIPNSLTL